MNKFILLFLLTTSTLTLKTPEIIGHQIVDDDNIAVLQTYKNVLIPAVENGLANLSSSSEWDSNHSASHARLHYTDRVGASSWSAAKNVIGEYMQLGFGRLVALYQLKIQGREDIDQWVTTFKLQTTLNGSNFTLVNGGQEYNANKDRNSIVTITFNPPIYCVSLRILPETWQGHISLRTEAMVTTKFEY